MQYFLAMNLSTLRLALLPYWYYPTQLWPPPVAAPPQRVQSTRSNAQAVAGQNYTSRFVRETGGGVLDDALIPRSRVRSQLNSLKVRPL